jgi:hypothetical protein
VALNTLESLYFQPLTFSGTLTINPANGTCYSVVLNGNLSLAIDNGQFSGQRLVLRLSQDSTGNHTLTLPSNVSYPAGINSITLSTGANLTDYVALIWNDFNSKWNVTSVVLGYT